VRPVPRGPQILAAPGVLDPAWGYAPDGALRRYAVALDVVTDLLGWLLFGNGVRDDLADQPRRATYRAAVAPPRGLSPTAWLSRPT
jgi:hypothetical protein